MFRTSLVLWLQLVFRGLKAQAQAFLTAWEGGRNNSSTSPCLLLAKLPMPQKPLGSGASSIQREFGHQATCSSLHTPEFLQASVPSLCQFLLLYKSRPETNWRQVRTKKRKRIRTRVAKQRLLAQQCDIQYWNYPNRQMHPWWETMRDIDSWYFGVWGCKERPFLSWKFYPIA